MDARTRRWVEEHVGSFDIVSTYAHEHGYSQLWRLRIAGGRIGDKHVWLKCHRHPPKWAGEVHALTKWAPELGLAPETLAWRASPPAVILSEVPGRPAQSLSLAPDQERRLWAEAGEWLRRLHSRTNPWLGGLNPDGSAHGETTTDAEGFVIEICDRRLREGHEDGLFTPEEAEFIRTRSREWATSLRGAGAHAIHRDFSPRNWMAHEDGSLAAVIDFEHARWDVRAADLNRWWDHEFLRHPELEDAFFEAYGRPDPTLQAQILMMRLLNCGGGYVWAARNNSPDYAIRLRAGLHRLMEERA